HPDGNVDGPIPERQRGDGDGQRDDGLSAYEARGPADRPRARGRRGACIGALEAKGGAASSFGSSTRSTSPGGFMSEHAGSGPTLHTRLVAALPAAVRPTVEKAIASAKGASRATKIML